MSDRFVLGRNYIETLLLTLTRIKLANPSADTMEFVAKQLEIEVCAFAMVLPAVEKSYHRFIEMQVERISPSLPRPSFRQCTAFDDLVQYCKIHKTEIIGPRAEYMKDQDVEKVCRTLVARIVEIATRATLYANGLIPLRGDTHGYG